MSLTTDDPGADGTSGRILDGRLTFSNEAGDVTDIYCVGAGATFARSASEKLDFSSTLTEFSKIGSCASNAALGNLTFCVQAGFIGDSASR
ncbi:MAG TPA: hypothetical protein VFZ61_12925 [Polyangiales bacterium]